MPRTPDTRLDRRCHGSSVRPDRTTPFELFASRGSAANTKQHSLERRHTGSACTYICMIHLQGKLSSAAFHHRPVADNMKHKQLFFCFSFHFSVLPLLILLSPTINRIQLRSRASHQGLIPPAHNSFCFRGGAPTLSGLVICVDLCLPTLN